MKKQLILILFFAVLFLPSCSSDSHHEETPTDQTILMYLPWSGNLTSYFRQNIQDFESVVATGALNNERLLVFFSSSGTTSELFEITYIGNGNTKRTTLKTYTFEDTNFTTAEGITEILTDVKNIAPANSYAMTIGCHGFGWLPVTETSRRSGQMYHFEASEEPITRFFGGTSSLYQTEISTLKEGIRNAGIGKLDYLLFDDCYMANVETAYELRDVTHYLIACPTEIMAYGMPYAEIGKYLIGSPTESSLANISNNFLEFYSSYEHPYATFSITDCSQLDALAVIMKEINANFTFDSSLSSSLQRMDGYSPVIFYDLGDYVSKLCTDADLLANFEAQLELVVPTEYRKRTTYFPSAYNQDGSGQYVGGVYRHYISSYSGITTSDPSSNSLTTTKSQTSWYIATH